MIWFSERLERMRNAPLGAQSGIALISAVFFMVIVAGMSVVLLSVILSQATQGYVAQKNTKTVYAAQAGLQAALGILRSAALPANSEGDVFGDPTKLPCTITGAVDGDPGGATYSTTIRYFAADPIARDETWRAANDFDCDASGVDGEPRFALITSTGQDSALPGNANAAVGNRALSAIYKFKVTNINVAGGMIFSFTNTFCMEAVSATAGSRVIFRAAAACSGNARQMWIYDTDYQIKLASTAQDGAQGLCITGPANDGEATQDALLRDCRLDTDANRWNQLWSWTGSHSWVGQKKVMANGPSTYCLSPDAANGTDLTGKYLKVRTGCNGGFAPSTSLGAGAASKSTNQIVNYKEFGRCADVTGENINATYMISYPCKQDPTGTGVNLLWNHKWFYNEPANGIQSPPQTITVRYLNDVAQTRCLTAPAGGASGDLIFVACNNSPQQNWVRVYDSGDYATSYLFINGTKCMTADPTSVHDGVWSKVRVAPCNGSLAQKWNAPPTYVDSSVGGYREIAG